VHPNYEADIGIPDADRLSAGRNTRNRLHRRVNGERPTGTTAAQLRRPLAYDDETLNRRQVYVGCQLGL
jgi:hypothetical protein